MNVNPDILILYFFGAVHAWWDDKLPITPDQSLKDVLRVSLSQDLYKWDCMYMPGMVQGGDFAQIMNLLFEGKIVWNMHVVGHWANQEVADFVRRALWENYQRSLWIAGRGPVEYHEQGSPLVYRNTVHKASFQDFSGIEEVRDASISNILVGSSEYRGRMFRGGK